MIIFPNDFNNDTASLNTNLQQNGSISADSAVSTFPNGKPYVYINSGGAGLYLGFHSSGKWGVQLNMTYNLRATKVRYLYNGVWEEWKTLSTTDQNVKCTTRTINTNAYGTCYIAETTAFCVIVSDPADNLKRLLAVKMDSYEAHNWTIYHLNSGSPIKFYGDKDLSAKIYYI